MPDTAGARAIDPAQRLEHALGLAYRHLAQRDRTIAEVRGVLERRGVDEQTRDAAIATLCDQGYLDDASFARRFVEDRRALDGWGSERIGQRMRALGVERELIEQALAKEGGQADLTTAVELLRRRVRGQLEDPRARQRALGMLMRKGYELELAHEALRALQHEQ